jgi:hypothetical protein
MIRFLTVLTLILVSLTARSQQKVTINGYVKDASNGEELIGVAIYIPQLKAGTVTNSYGFYAITVPPGPYEIVFSYLGYTPFTFKGEVTANLSQNIEMETEAKLIEEIVITEKRIDENVSDVQMSRNTIDIARIKKLPSLFGEVDIIKNIQMLPGVVSAGEGTSAFFVRGGSADQNLILIDEAPVYDPSHLFGLFSVFNADVIKDSDLYKGGIPPRFGGRLSSILDVRTKDGNNKNFGITGGIGTLATRVAVEGPLKKDKSSFIISGRRSYADVFMKAAGEKTDVYFYDINAKVNWRQNNNNRFFVAMYAGRDVFKLDDEFGFGWGNMTGTFRWNHLFNEKLFSNISVIGSQFDYKLEIHDEVQGLKWTSSLQEVSVKADLSYALNTNNEITFGYHITGRHFFPGKIGPNTESSFFTELEQQRMYALDHALYIGNQQKVSDKISLDYGLRLSFFQNVGKGHVYKYEDPTDAIGKNRTDTVYYDGWETIKSYFNFEPRIGIRYMLKEGQSFKLSYNRMVQNTHLVSASTVPVPFNTWTPSNYYLKPQLADQIALGYFRNFKDNMFEASVETFYKDINNVTDFADNAELFFNEDLSTEYRQGDSWAYGAEFMVNKNSGRLTGMLSYTLSKVERKIPEVNGGKTFDANYDRRNSLNIQAAYDLNPKWTFGASFTYNTGRPITLGSGKWQYGDYNPDIITERNGYRLPDFHRLDLSATLTPKKNINRRWKGQWVFAIYNVYNRKNPFTIYTRTLQDKEGNIIGDGRQKEARLIYLFPILPSVTYNFKF